MPVSEDSLNVPGDDQSLCDSAPERRVLDVVDDRGAVASIDEEMLVPPQSVRAPDLKVHEAMRRFPILDLGPPAQGDSPPMDSIVDEGARRHHDRPLGEDFESKPRRGQFLEVPGLSKERKHFFEGNRQDQFVAVRKCLHREDPTSAREAIARTSPEKMIL